MAVPFWGQRWWWSGDGVEDGEIMSDYIKFIGLKFTGFIIFDPSLSKLSNSEVWWFLIHPHSHDSKGNHGFLPLLYWANFEVWRSSEASQRLLLRVGWFLADVDDPKLHLGTLIPNSTKKWLVYGAVCGIPRGSARVLAFHCCHWVHGRNKQMAPGIIRIHALLFLKKSGAWHLVE